MCVLARVTTRYVVCGQIRQIPWALVYKFIAQDYTAAEFLTNAYTFDRVNSDPK